MKKLLFVFLLSLLICTALPCAAQISKVDPILLATPNPWVYECTDELVLELLVAPVIEYSTGGKDAENYFFFFTVEFLYLQDRPWNGLDKNSFMLKHTGSDGSAEIIPLNYMMTSMMSLKNHWKTMADPLQLGSLIKLELVFDVDTMDQNGWSLLMRPAERGSYPVCEMEIPLTTGRLTR